MKWKSSLTISLLNFDYLPDEDGKEVDVKMRMKKFERMNLIFEFSVSKLGYMAIFMKMWEKNTDPFLIEVEMKM